MINRGILLYYLLDAVPADKLEQLPRLPGKRRLEFQEFGTVMLALTKTARRRIRRTLFRYDLFVLYATQLNGRNIAICCTQWRRHLVILTAEKTLVVEEPYQLLWLDDAAYEIVVDRLRELAASSERERPHPM